MTKALRVVKRPEPIMAHLLQNAKVTSARKEMQAAMEMQLLEESMSIEQAAMMAKDLDANGNPPDWWLKEFGEENTRRILNIARDATKRAIDAPVYLEHAKATMIGIQRHLDSQKQQEFPSINLQIVVGGNGGQAQVQVNQYQVRTVEHKDE